MSTVQEMLYWELAHDGPVAALVGVRIYPAGDVPQNAILPRVTYQRISHQRHGHQSSAGTLWEDRFQINSLAASPTAAEILGRAVVNALDRKRGSLGDPASALTVRAIISDAGGEDYEPPVEGTERGPHRDRMDFIVWYSE